MNNKPKEARVLDWDLPKLREMSAGTRRTVSENKRCVKILSVGAEYTSQLMAKIRYYDNVDGREYIRQILVHSDEGRYVLPRIEEGGSYLATSVRQYNGYWAWTQLQDIPE